MEQYMRRDQESSRWPISSRLVGSDDDVGKDFRNSGKLEPKLNELQEKARKAIRDPKGGNMDEWPDDLRIREGVNE